MLNSSGVVDGDLYRAERQWLRNVGMTLNSAISYSSDFACHIRGFKINVRKSATFVTAMISCNFCVWLGDHETLAHQCQTLVSDHIQI